MKEIEFKAKCLKTSRWIFGYYVNQGLGCHYIVYYDESKNKTIAIEIDVETVSQYTGFKDKDKNKIFENDIIEELFLERGFYSKVVFAEGCYQTVAEGTYIELSEDYTTSRVVGNIFDNVDLLSKK